MKDNLMIFDFSYLDVHFDMIKNKIKTFGKVSIFNGFVNKIYKIEKFENEYIYYHTPFDDMYVKIDYNDLIEEFMHMYNTSAGKITVIYRIFTNSINSKTNGEFRELWGDVLFIDPNTLKLKSINISAENLSNIVLGIELDDEEKEIFGRVEEYVFKDNDNNVILGLDLI